MHPASGNPETAVVSPHRKGVSVPPPHFRGGEDVSGLLDVDEQSPTGQLRPPKGGGQVQRKIEESQSQRMSGAEREGTREKRRRGDAESVKRGECENSAREKRRRGDAESVKRGECENSDEGVAKKGIGWKE